MHIEIPMRFRNPYNGRREVNAEFFRFLVTGAYATTLHYLVFWLGISGLSMNASLASGTGYLSGSVLSYFMNYYYTFDSKRPHREAVGLFYLIVATGFFINTGSFFMLTRRLSWNPWFAQVGATALALLWNFFFSRLFVFCWRKR